MIGLTRAAQVSAPGSPSLAQPRGVQSPRLSRFVGSQAEAERVARLQAVAQRAEDRAHTQRPQAAMVCVLVVNLKLKVKMKMKRAETSA